jgi:hypothetical protein
MTIGSTSAMRNFLANLSLAAACGAVLCTMSFAQQLSGEIVKRELISEHDVAITYNLFGPASMEYDVVLYLIAGTGPKQRLERTSGDVGSGVKSGYGKVIHWDMKSELPNPLEGMTYQFELDVRKHEGGGLAWYWWAGGAAAVAVGIVVAVLPKGEGETGGGQVVPPSIPLPPAR